MLRGSRIDPRAFVHPAGHNQADVMALTQQVLEMLAPKEPAAADEQPHPAPQPKRRSKQEP